MFYHFTLSLTVKDKVIIFSYYNKQCFSMHTLQWWNKDTSTVNCGLFELSWRQPMYSVTKEYKHLSLLKKNISFHIGKTWFYFSSQQLATPKAVLYESGVFLSLYQEPSFIPGHTNIYIRGNWLSCCKHKTYDP